MTQVIPAMKEKGGYIACFDHTAHQTVSLGTFRHFVELAKQLGSYE
jgi:hypothetical protein